MKVSIIIINYNTPELVYTALESIRAHEPDLQKEFIVIDNSSREPVTAGRLGADVQLITNTDNRGFAAAANQGAARASGKYLIFFNSDAKLTNAAFSELVRLLDTDETIAVVGPRLTYEDGATQVSCGRFPTVWREFLKITKLDRIVPGGSLLYDVPANRAVYAQTSDVDWVSGGCLVTRRALFEQLGGLDEAFFFGIEDVDYGYRVRQAGGRVVFFPQLSVTHRHGRSAGGKRSLFRLRHERFGIMHFLHKHRVAGPFGCSIVSCLHGVKIAGLRIAVRLT